MFKEGLSQGCIANHDLKSITATNGKIYFACIPFSFIPVFGGQSLKVYIFPQTIVVEGGYLERISGDKVGYVFYETGKEPNSGDSDILPIKVRKTNTGLVPDTQLIPGMDNIILIIAGIAIFLMMKN